MSNFEQSSIFKELFTSLELATNCDGINRSNHELDSEIGSICETESDNICELRQYNNRLKHHDKNLQDLSTYQKGSKNLSRNLISLKKLTQTMILERLSNSVRLKNKSNG